MVDLNYTSLWHLSNLAVNGFAWAEAVKVKPCKYLCAYTQNHLTWIGVSSQKVSVSCWWITLSVNYLNEASCDGIYYAWSFSLSNTYAQTQTSVSVSPRSTVILNLQVAFWLSKNILNESVLEEKPVCPTIQRKKDNFHATNWRRKQGNTLTESKRLTLGMTCPVGLNAFVLEALTKPFPFESDFGEGLLDLFGDFFLPVPFVVGE